MTNQDQPTENNNPFHDGESRDVPGFNAFTEEQMKAYDESEAAVAKELTGAASMQLFKRGFEIGAGAAHVIADEHAIAYRVEDAKVKQAILIHSAKFAIDLGAIGFAMSVGAKQTVTVFERMRESGPPSSQLSAVEPMSIDDLAIITAANEGVFSQENAAVLAGKMSDAFDVEAGSLIGLSNAKASVFCSGVMAGGLAVAHNNVGKEGMPSMIEDMIGFVDQAAADGEISSDRPRWPVFADELTETEPQHQASSQESLPAVSL